MIWIGALVLALILGATAYFWWRGREETTGAQLQAWEMTGPAPDGALDFLDALGRNVGIPGGRVEWFTDRIPYVGGGSGDEFEFDPWLPSLQCRNMSTWKALLVHSVGHVLHRRAGQGGEPDPVWCSATLAAVEAEIARRGG